LKHSFSNAHFFLREEDARRLERVERGKRVSPLSPLACVEPSSSPQLGRKKSCDPDGKALLLSPPGVNKEDARGVALPAPLGEGIEAVDLVYEGLWRTKKFHSPLRFSFKTLNFPDEQRKSILPWRPLSLAFSSSSTLFLCLRKKARPSLSETVLDSSLHNGLFFPLSHFLLEGKIRSRRVENTFMSLSSPRTFSTRYLCMQSSGIPLFSPCLSIPLRTLSG